MLETSLLLLIYSVEWILAVAFDIKVPPNFSSVIDWGKNQEGKYFSHQLRKAAIYSGIYLGGSQVRGFELRREVVVTVTLPISLSFLLGA